MRLALVLLAVRVCCAPSESRERDDAQGKQPQ
jgi:hypothetical protein